MFQCTVNVFQCVAVRHCTCDSNSSVGVFQCVAMCSVSQCFIVRHCTCDCDLSVCVFSLLQGVKDINQYSVFQCVSVPVYCIGCFSVLQCVIVYCSVFQRVVVRNCTCDSDSSVGVLYIS